MRYVSVTKPGIIFGNIITVSGGYFLGSQTHFYFWPFLAALIGMSFVIASGCVFNNFIDQDIDVLMERTKNRPLVLGTISDFAALLYATLLGIIGFIILYCFTNFLTVITALIGLFFYVIIYTLWLKRRSIYGTIIGGVAGAVPPVAGYCAATNQFDMGAVILFLILFLWQIPHFYAISIYRLKDFSAASIPILPVEKNITYTKISMLIYIVAFLFASIMPSILGYIGIIYFVAALSLGLVWLLLGFQGLKAKNDSAWAKKMFLFSIINITLLCVMMLIKQ